MFPPIAFMEMDAAESPRIGQTQRLAAEFEVDVIVWAGCRTGANDSQASRHSEMDDQRAGLGLQHEIFGATKDARDALAARMLRQYNRPTQARITHRPTGDAAFQNCWRD